RQRGPQRAGEWRLALLVGPAGPRAEGRGGARSGRPAADDELLQRPDLQLQPGRCPPARLVARSAELGDDPLEVALTGGLDERLAVADDVGREPDPRRLAEDRAEHPLAVLERDLEERSPVDIQQVADLVDERPGRSRRARGPGSRPSLADPLLEEREVRPALV